MKDGGWIGRFGGSGVARRRPDATLLEDAAGPVAAAESPRSPGDDLRARIGSAAFAFRGYDVQNLGRSRELMEHPHYGHLVRKELADASAIASESLREKIDLEAYVRASAPTSLEDFPTDVALIVAMEMAQLRLLEEFFGVPVLRAKRSVGYSIGELSALVLGGSFRLEELLPVPLGLSVDCASLAEDTSMAILFTRSPSLPEAHVQHLCDVVSGEGKGIVAPSAILSPNTTILLGQGKTLDRVDALREEFLPAKVLLRRNPNRWPPLHTPIVRQRNIPNRAAVALYAIPGHRPSPMPRLISCVTGETCDEHTNSRELLIQWTERPQRLWDAIDTLLASGVETVIHVGPSPNLIPATFARLANNVNKQLNRKYLFGLGRGMASGMTRNAWLASLLPERAALLRAPFLNHVILEDWLLSHSPVLN